MKTISATSVSTYNTCPLQWYFNYQLQLLKPPYKAFDIGTAYHKYVELVHTNIEEPLIKKEIRKLLIKDNTKEEIENFALVCQMGRKYSENKIEGQTDCLEYRFSRKVPGLPVPLFGFIDRLDDKIIEYKTTSFDFKQEDIQTIQSKIYTYVFWSSHKNILPVVYSVMNKLKAHKDNYVPQRLEVKYQEKDMIQLEDTLRQFYQNILDKKFPHTPGQHCYWCAWGKKQLNNCEFSI